MTKILIRYSGNLLKRSGNLFTGYEGAPITNFNASGSTASQVSITIGGSLNFYDTSTKNPTSWKWNFGNATPSTSTLQNPTGITFSLTGTTTISLTTTNIYGSNTNTKTNYINVNPISLNKLAVDVSAAPFGGLGLVPYYSGFTWTPSGMSQRSWTWNMFASDVLGGIPTGQTMILKYTDNTLSNYILKVMPPLFSGNYNNGKTTGNDTGIYPDSILMYSYVNYSNSPKQYQMLRLTNLNIATTYKLTFLGSRANVGAATSRYTITGGTNKDATYVTLDSMDNVMNTVSISGISPSPSGIIDIGVDYAVGSPIGFINAMEIDEGG